MSHIVVFVTVGNREEASHLARVLVEERLAACVNLLPSMASTYWWRGQIEQANEVLLVMKTRQDLLEFLTARVRTLHSYTVPEVIAVPLICGNPDDLAWIDESVRREDQGD